MRKTDDSVSSENDDAVAGASPLLVNVTEEITQEIEPKSGLIAATNREIYLELIKLATPLALSGYVQISSSVFVSWQTSQLGETLIAEYSLAKHAVPLLLTMGALFAPLPGRLAVLNAGTGNIVKVRYGFQASYLGTAIVSVPISVGLLFMPNVLAALGLSSALSSSAGFFARCYIVNVPFILLNLSDLAFLEITKQQNYVLLYQIVTSGVRILLSYTLTAKLQNFPQWGLLGLSLAEGGAALSGFLLLKTIIRRKPATRDYHLFQIRRHDWRRILLELKSQILLGLPVMAYRLSLAGQEFVAGMVIGWSGSKQLALNSASGFYIGFLSPVVDALASATMIQAGRYLSARPISDMKKMFGFSILTALGVCAIPAVPYLVFPNQLAENFIGDLSELTVSVRGVFALMLLGWSLEKLKAIGAAHLIGIGDTKTPAVGNLVGDLLIIIPLVLILGYFTQLGLIGVDSAVVLGFAVGTVIIMLSLGRSFSQENRVTIDDNPAIEMQSRESHQSEFCEQFRFFRTNNMPEASLFYPPGHDMAQEDNFPDSRN
jgi:MATE family multidrug resistance protein